MSHLFQSDQSRVMLYLDENAGWLKVITTQADELPVLEKILHEKESGLEDMVAEKDHFTKLLQLQHEQMKQLNSELNAQQSRLEKDAAGASLYDIESLCSQDILRDRIREVEGKYIELKCNFMRFMSAII